MEENNARDIAVQKCVETLQRARTDNEKFAALLLIANADKIYKFSAGERRLVYGYIEFTFVWRLLNSKKDPEGCDKGMLLAIGLTIFSCMIEEMATEDQFENVRKPKCIGRLLEIISSSLPHMRNDESPNEDLQKEMVSNCFQILNVLAQDLPSSEQILGMGMKCFIESTKGENITEIGIQSAMLVCQCLNTRNKNKSKELKDHRDNLNLFMNNVSHLFAVAQNEEKFTLLEILVNMIADVKEKKVFDTSEMIASPFLHLQQMRTGLMDILQSKVNEKYRHLAIKLSAVMIEVYGLDWTSLKFQHEQEKYSKKFLLLLMSLVSVEINMFFYDRKEDCNILSTLFSITENVIEAISDLGDTTSSNKDLLTSEIISKLLHMINNVITVIIAYLDEFKGSDDIEDACMNVKIIACMRLLCAYMSEETSAMRKEILKLEPFMLKLAKAAYTINKKAMFQRISTQDETAEESSPNIFNFLLPVLCHWSADEKTRKALLDEEVHVTLWGYLEKLLSCHSTKVWVYQSLETVFGIFLNIAITEAELACSSTLFADILTFLMTNLDECSSMPANLVMNMITLGLILVRAQVTMQLKNKEGVNRFFQIILKMLCDSCPYLQQQNAQTNWPDISELWLIAMDNMIACIDLYPGLSDILKTLLEFQMMIQFLGRKEVAQTDDFRSVLLIITNFVKKVMEAT